MLLVIDVGNTNVTTALVVGGRLLTARRASTQRAATVDELDLLLGGLLGLDDAGWGDVEAIAATSVVPTVSHGIEAVGRRRERTVLMAGPGVLPLAIRVDRPGDVGTDRLVNALAAYRLHGGPIVVADCGTATTVDAVGPDGAFLGGAIAPGLQLGLDALSARTAKLPLVELRQPDRAIGRDTVSALQSGSIFGYQALVAGLLARVRRELGEMTATDPGRISTIVTGGLSAAPWVRGLGADVVDPDLTLKGLAIMFAEVGGGEALRSDAG
jgi:type III pantothenate kinase